MPYITHLDKENILVHRELPDTAGKLNFFVTHYIIEYMNLKGLNYQTINDIVGALEGAKLEFYRRIAVPYENKKIQENGDVYK